MAAKREKGRKRRKKRGKTSNEGGGKDRIGED